MYLCRSRTNFPDLPNEIQIRVLQFLLRDVSITIMITDFNNGIKLYVDNYSTHLLPILRVCKGLRMAAAEILHKTLELNILTPMALPDIGSLLPRFYLTRIRKLSIYTYYPNVSLSMPGPWSHDQVGDFLNKGFLTKALLAPLPNVASIIISEDELHCGGCAMCHVTGASTKKEVLNASNDQMVEAINVCFETTSECRSIVLDELDNLDRNVTVSIDVDVYTDEDYGEEVRAGRFLAKRVAPKGAWSFTHITNSQDLVKSDGELYVVNCGKKSVREEKARC